jgi:hypothetical protein
MAGKIRLTSESEFIEDADAFAKEMDLVAQSRVSNSNDFVICYYGHICKFVRENCGLVDEEVIAQLVRKAMITVWKRRQELDGPKAGIFISKSIFETSVKFHRHNRSQLIAMQKRLTELRKEVKRFKKLYGEYLDGAFKDIEQTGN